jgi:hypothetical protein
VLDRLEQQVLLGIGAGDERASGTMRPHSRIMRIARSFR